MKRREEGKRGGAEALPLSWFEGFSLGQELKTEFCSGKNPHFLPIRKHFDIYYCDSLFLKDKRLDFSGEPRSCLIPCHKISRLAFSSRQEQ